MVLYIFSYSRALCFCLVNFDLDVGQSLEAVYPEQTLLSEREKRNVSFSAFPDSNSSQHGGDSCFSFRMRSGHWSRELYRNTHPSNPSSDTVVNTRSRAASEDINLSSTSTTEIDPEVPTVNDPTFCMKGVVPIETDGFTYGYVFFRQKSDSAIRRGFFQKSLVILSPHPWKGLFLNIVRLLGSKLMDCIINDRESDIDHLGPGSSAFDLLVRAYEEIANWYFCEINIKACSTCYIISLCKLYPSEHQTAIFQYQEVDKKSLFII
jgi:hypothetical protein